MDRVLCFPIASSSLERPWGEMCEKHAILRCPRIGARIRQKSIDKRLQMALLSAPRGPNSRSKPKPRHLIGKKIILILLTKPMHRETASRRYKRVQIGLGDYSFLPTYELVL